jgi:four helix bundle protein
MFSYQNLEVYKKSVLANQKVYCFLKTNTKIAGYVKNQFGRASLSIMLNIAEGSSKFSKKDRKNFYVTSRGSTFECNSLLSFLYDQGEIEKELKEKLEFFYEEISKMLFTMIKNLDKG